MAAGAVDLLGDAVDSAERRRTKRGAIPAWAERYGYGVRQIKNWLADGDKQNDPPPMDHPERMVEWFERVYSKKAPDRLTDAVARLTGKTPVAASPAGEVAAKPAEPAEPFVRPSIEDHELGIEAQLDGYRREWVMLGKMRATALEKSDFGKASKYLEQQQSVSAEIRQLERLLPTVLEQRGDYQKTADVRSSMTEFLTVLKTSLFGHGAKCGQRLRATASDVEFTKAWREELERVFGAVCEREFGPDFQLSDS